MNQETQVQTPGEEFGRTAVAEVLSKAHNYCDHETQRIALANNSKITALRAQLSLLHEEDKKLQERLHRALPAGDLKERRRQGHLLLVGDGVSCRRGLFLLAPRL